MIPRAVLFALLTSLVMTGGFTACGKRGDPQPPFQHIPSPVAKARVSQRGPVILVEWEAPTKTTDGSELRLGEVEVLRRFVEPPPPVPETQETPEMPTTEEISGVTETDGVETAGTGAPVEEEASEPVPPAGTISTTPEEPIEDPTPESPGASTPTPPEEPSETPVEDARLSQEASGETTTEPPTDGATAPPTEGQIEGVDQGEELVMTPPPSVLQMSIKPKGFGEEARIIAKLEVDPSGSPLSYQDEWQPRWKGKRLEYAVRYVNPKGLKGAHSRPTAIEPVPPLPAPSGLSATAGDGLVSIAWEQPPGLAEWREASEQEGVTFELGFNVYRKPAEGTYPSTAPVNRKPLVEPSFEDRTVKFGKDWCYVVRGVAVPIIPEPPPEPAVDAIEGSSLMMPSDEQVETAVSELENAAPNPTSVVGGVTGVAEANLAQAKKLLPPEPPALIESENTNEICLKPVDTFPPAAPTRLVALETPDGILISWSESAAQDLKGFFVYRADESSGPFELLTKNPVPLPSFTDRNLSPGATYFYAVSAVDSAEPPNESDRSSPIAATALE